QGGAERGGDGEAGAAEGAAAGRAGAAGVAAAGGRGLQDAAGAAAGDGGVHGPGRRDDDALLQAVDARGRCAAGGAVQGAAVPARVQDDQPDAPVGGAGAGSGGGGGAGGGEGGGRSGV